MINQTLRNKAIEAVNLLDNHEITVVEKQVVSACWWLLYTIGFEAGRDRIDHLKHAKSLIDEVLTHIDK